jgi:hypothetical protein
MTEQHEARLRAALRAEAEEVDVDPNAWSKVQRQAAARERRTPWLAVAAAVVVGGMAIGAGVLFLDDDDTTVDLVPAGDDSTTTTVDEPTPATSVPAAEDELLDAIWPFTTRSDVEEYVADPGVGMFFDPEATALEFAREYLGMPDPHGGGEGIDAEGMPEDEAYLIVQPKQGSPMATTVHMRRYGGDDGPWSVTFTETRNIEVDRQVYEDPQTGTIQLSGRSSAFEAQVNVEARDVKGNVLGETFVMGGGGPDLEPFSGELVLDRLPVTPFGALLFVTYSAEDGALQEATVIPIRFATGDATGTSFSLYFHRGEELVEVTRSGAATTGVLRQALDALVAGPRPEDGEGLSSLFSEDTAGVIAGVNLRDGTAIVDFAETVNNASTSAGSEAFLAELNATIFQFETVSQIEYRLQGSCEAFWEWLQRGGCEPVER